MMHYASLAPATRDNEKVKEIAEQYQNDDLDFHQIVADMAGVSRTHAKTINLGIMYGMGIGKLAATLGDKKAIVLKNHGHLTVGQSVEEATWWYVTMERSCGGPTEVTKPILWAINVWSSPARSASGNRQISFPRQ